MPFLLLYSSADPGLYRHTVNIFSYNAAQSILERPKDFKVAWGKAPGRVMGKSGWDFMLSGESKQRKLVGDSLDRDQWHRQIKDFYEYTTLELLHQHSCKIAGLNQVDITRQ